jgi:hypothetical protein
VASYQLLAVLAAFYQDVPVRLLAKTLFLHLRHLKNHHSIDRGLKSTPVGNACQIQLSGSGP